MVTLGGALVRASNFGVAAPRVLLFACGKRVGPQDPDAGAGWPRLRCARRPPSLTVTPVPASRH